MSSVLLKEGGLVLGADGKIILTDNPALCPCCEAQPFYRCCTSLCFGTRRPEDQPPGINPTVFRIGGTMRSEDRHEQPFFGSTITKEFVNEWGKFTNYDLSWDELNCPRPIERAENRLAKDFTWCPEVIRNTTLSGQFLGSYSYPFPNVYRFRLVVSTISEMFLSGDVPPNCEVGQVSVGTIELSYRCDVSHNSVTGVTTIDVSDDNGTVNDPTAPNGGTITTNATITPISLAPGVPCKIGFNLELSQERLSVGPLFNRPMRVAHTANLEIRMVGIAQCVGGEPFPLVGGQPASATIVSGPVGSAIADPRLANLTPEASFKGGCCG